MKISSSIELNKKISDGWRLFYDWDFGRPFIRLENEEIDLDGRTYQGARSRKIPIEVIKRQ